MNQLNQCGFLFKRPSIDENSDIRSACLLDQGHKGEHKIWTGYIENGKSYDKYEFVS